MYCLTQGTTAIEHYSVLYLVQYLFQDNHNHFVNISKLHLEHLNRATAFLEIYEEEERNKDSTRERVNRNTFYI